MLRKTKLLCSTQLLILGLFFLFGLVSCGGAQTIKYVCPDGSQQDTPCPTPTPVTNSTTNPTTTPVAGPTQAPSTDGGCFGGKNYQMPRVLSGNVYFRVEFYIYPNPEHESWLSPGTWKVVDGVD